MRTENLAIVFVDIAGFTPRTSAQTRAENERMLRRFDGVVRPLVRAYDGRVVKTLGDAYLLAFRSATNAVLCAMGIHDRLAETDAEVDPDSRFTVRAAINVGDVRIDDGDVFGEAVNVASRIEGQAAPGEIQLSEATWLAMTRSEVPAEEIGLVKLKGVQEKVRLFRVPRADESGGYVLSQRFAGAERAASPPAGPALAPPALPFGGLALGRVRERLQQGTASQLIEPVAAHARGLAARVPGWSQRARTQLGRAWAWWRVEVRRSREVQVGTAIVAVAVLALLWWWLIHEPEPATPWQRFQRGLRGR